MARKHFAILLFLCVCQSQGQSIADLQAYYENRVEVDFLELLRELRSETISKRRAASERLLRIVRQTFEDERNQTAPWKTPWLWAEPDRNPARTLRSWLVMALSQKNYGDAATPTIAYLLRKEPSTGAVRALQTTTGKRADGLIRSLLTSSDDRPALKRAALEEAVRRRLDVSSSDIRRLAHHLLPSIRAAARALGTALGHPDPGPFQPAVAMQEEYERGLVQDFLDVLTYLPEANAQLVEILVPAPDGSECLEVEMRGWEVGKDASSLTVLTHLGERREVKTHVKEREKDQRRVVVRQVESGEDLARLDAERRKGYYGLSPYETAVGCWHAKAGRYGLAARYLMSTLDVDLRHPDPLNYTKQWAAESFYAEMTRAYVGDRNYDSAISHAREVRRLVPGSTLATCAAELENQLQRRKAEDFETLRLPTMEEWKILRNILTSTERIDFLMARLRLLNSFVTRSPLTGKGEVWEGAQFAEAGGWERTRFGNYLREGKTPTVNPVEALLGTTKTSHVNEAERFSVTRSDLPQLAKYLDEDWYTLKGEDFPCWRIVKVREVVSSIVNRLIGFKLLDGISLDQLPADARKAVIREIVVWARESGQRTENENLVPTLRLSLKCGSRWDDVEDVARRAVKLDQQEVVPVLFGFAEVHDTDGRSIDWFFEVAKELAPDRALSIAVGFLDHPNPVLRIKAAYHAFVWGEVEVARKAMAEVFRISEVRPIGEEPFLRCVKALLSEGSDVSRRQAFQYCLRTLESRHVPNALVLKNGTTVTPRGVRKGLTPSKAARFIGRALKGHAPANDPFDVDSARAWLREQLRTLPR